MLVLCRKLHISSYNRRNFSGDRPPLRDLLPPLIHPKWRWTTRGHIIGTSQRVHVRVHRMNRPTVLVSHDARHGLYAARCSGSPRTIHSTRPLCSCPDVNRTLHAANTYYKRLNSSELSLQPAIQGRFQAIVCIVYDSCTQS